MVKEALTCILQKPAFPVRDQCVQKPAGRQFMDIFSSWLTVGQVADGKTEKLPVLGLKIQITSIFIRHLVVERGRDS